MSLDADNEPDWFWGDISRSQANELLQGAIDGSFLVRNSSSNAADLTLTVKKDGVNKMMRILCRNGRYGFREPLQFRSLKSLIELHQRQPLTEYNQEMDICLLHPISKQAVLGELPADAAVAAAGLAAAANSVDGKNSVNTEHHVERLMSLLVKANQDYLLVTQEYDRLFDGYNKSLNDVQMYKQALESFNEVVAILEEQLRLNETLQREAMVHEVALMTKHQQALHAKLRQVHEDRSKLDSELRKILLSSRTLDRQINELKPQIHEHKRSREQLSALLIRQGVRRELIERRLEQQQQLIDSTAMGFETDHLHYHGEETDPDDRLDSVLEASSSLPTNTGETTLNYSCLDTDFLARAAQQNNRWSPGIDEPDVATRSSSFLTDTITNVASESPPAATSSSVTGRNQEHRNTITEEIGSDDKENVSTTRDGDDEALDEELERQLQRMEWYVGEMSRDQINDLLQGAPEGTFLLRDSKQRSDAPYTLTVRKDGANKMLRVLNRHGKFGFKEPYEFESLIQLVRYHMRQPLLVSKSELVIHLLHPWSSELHRSYVTIESASNSF